MIVVNKRFLLNDPAAFLVYGILPEDAALEAVLNGEVLQTDIKDRTAHNAIDRYNLGEGIGGRRAVVTIRLPEKIRKNDRLSLYGIRGTEKRLWYRLGGAELLKLRDGVQFYIEEERVDHERKIVSVRGWAASDEAVAIRILDPHGREVPAKIKRQKRIDVADLYPECAIEEAAGFSFDLEGYDGPDLTICFTTGSGRSDRHVVGVSAFRERLKKAERYRKKGLDYLRGHGLRAFLQKSYTKITGSDEREIDYNKWIAFHLPKEEELARQREEVFFDGPRFSVVVPLYKTDPVFLKEMAESVLSQTYSDLELILSDGSGQDSPIAEILDSLTEKDGRVRTIRHKESLRIAENTNAALHEAGGDYLVFLDHDDLLAPHALYECASLIREHPDAELIYSDEDKISTVGNRFFSPHFKPDYNPDLLTSVNYMSHLTVVKKSLQEAVGDLDPEFDGSQDYDFLLRATEKTEAIYHIPKILYHWRTHEESTSENPESKRYAFEAGRRAIEAHYRRIGIDAEVSMGDSLGLYRTRYHLSEEPLVSILIPNKDHTEDLTRCIGSILERSTYRNVEILIIENNSTDEETFACYRDLTARDERIRVLHYEGPFNYSAINNFGANEAKGEVLLLLNNDTMVISPDFLTDLLGYGMRKDTGAVGARLYYGDDSIQHAGIVLGLGGIAGHCFAQTPSYDPGYFSRIRVAQDYSAVTAACLLTRKEVYEEVGGFTEELAVAFNDVDFCLKLREKGYRIVYDPYAELYHFESKSRGLEDTPEKLERFHKEIALLSERWKDVLDRPDPYYNPNLTLRRQDFSLKKIF